MSARDTGKSKQGGRKEGALALATGALILSLEEASGNISDALAPEQNAPRKPLQPGMGLAGPVEEPSAGAPGVRSGDAPPKKGGSAGALASDGGEGDEGSTAISDTQTTGSGGLARQLDPSSSITQATGSGGLAQQLALSNSIPQVTGSGGLVQQLALSSSIPLASGPETDPSVTTPTMSFSLMSVSGGEEDGSDLPFAALAAEPSPIRIQAENATLGKVGATTTTPAIVTPATASPTDLPRALAADGDAYVDFGNATPAGEYAEFVMQVDTSGYYDLAVGYALETGNRPLRLDVKLDAGAFTTFDRMFDLPATGSFATYGEQVTRVFLEAGQNTVRLTSVGASGPNLDYVELRAPDPNRIVIQAESLLPAPSVTDPTTVNRAITMAYLDSRSDSEIFRVGAEGDSYLDWSSAAASVLLPITAPVAGTYSIAITYANGSTARPISLTKLDGTVIGTFAFGTTATPTFYPLDYADIPLRLRPADGADAGSVPDPLGWEGWTKQTLGVNVSLQAGLNVLRLAGTGPGPNLDKIELVLVEAAPEPVAPTDISVASLTVAENVAAAQIGAVTVSDADSASHTLAVLENGVASTRFEIIGGQLRLKTGQSLDFETQASVAIQIVATDPGGLSLTRDFAVTVTNDLADDAPVVTNVAPVVSTTSLSTPENQVAVGAVAATDADGDVLSYALTTNAGTDNALFAIDPTSGALAFLVAPDFEALAGDTQFTVEVAVGDGEATTTKTLSVTVTNDPADDAPVVTNVAPVVSTTSLSTPENQVAVGAVAATDADGDVLSYALTANAGTDNALFAIDPTSGALAFLAAPDFEALAGDTQFTVEVAVGDGQATTTKTLSVTVTNQNEAPTVTGTLASTTLPSTGGTISLASLVTSDPDGDVTAFDVRAASGDLPTGIAVQNGALVVASTVAPGVYGLLVFARDGSLDSNSVPLTLSVSSPPPAVGQILIQAEAGALTLVDVDTNTNDTVVRNPWNLETNTALAPTLLRPNFSGSGYLDYGDTPGDKATYTFTITQAGVYDFHVRYGSNGARPLAFSLDGAAATNLPFVATGTNTSGPTEGFNNWGVQKVSGVQLSAGTHSISLAIPTGFVSGPNIDAIAITAAGATADFSAGNSNPLVAQSAFQVTEGTAVVGTVTASDPDGDRVEFSLTSNAATDNARFTINASTGALTFNTAPDFELPTDADANNSYVVEVSASDRTGTSLKTIMVTVANDPADDAPVVTNVAPVVSTTSLSTPENQAAAGTVAASDADGDTLSYALTANAATDNALFTINSTTGALSFLVAPDFEALAGDTQFTVEVAVGDGALTTTRTIAVSVTDVDEGGPVAVTFGALTAYSSQDRPQDGGQVVSTPSALTLDGNFWKRSTLTETYVITADTKLQLDLRTGTGTETPEISAIGFDLDEDPFDGDASIYQLGGTQTQGGFIDLRGSGTPNQDGSVRFVIDLGAHAGKSISSLVFINDDDSRPNLGSSIFSNVQFFEAADENGAPILVGGGIADRTLLETGSIEVDLPFLDPDGDALSFTVVVKNAAGMVVPAGNLAVVDGVLAGSVAALGEGVFTVTVTASDGLSSTSDSFLLTVNPVNDAPVADDVLLEPFVAQTGAAFAGFDVNSFAQYFADPNGDALTLTVEGLPQGLSINQEGYVSGTPMTAGTYPVIIRATDPAGLSDTITIQLVVGGQGNVAKSIEAEAFTGLSTAAGFFASGAATASGSQLVLLNQGASGSVSTNLSASGLANGFYKVTAYVFDETDGASTFSVSVGGTSLQVGGSSTVVLSDAGPGSFVNPSSARGTAANAGNLKAIAFDTVVQVQNGTVMTLSGQALGSESLRVDRFVFEPVQAANTAPTGLALTGSVQENVAGGVIGVLSATDAQGDAITFSTTDARFVVATNQVSGLAELKLATGVSLNHETANGTTVSVTATDSKGSATTSQLVLNVSDVNEAPVLSGTVATQAFEAGIGGQVSLAALVATDPDAGDLASLGARLAGGGALPAGITLSGGSLVVSGTVLAGTYMVELFGTDGELLSAPISFTVVVDPASEPEPFEPVVVQGEVAVVTLTQAADANSTMLRTQTSNPEAPGTGKILDQFGLRAGYTGTGYLDFGNDPGDKASFVVTVEEAGEYEIDIRYASSDARSLDLAVGAGAPATIQFASTGTPAVGSTPAVDGFNVWLTQTVTVTLQAGANTLSLAIPAGRTNGPNIDSLTIRQPGPPADISADADGNLFLSGPQGEITGAAKDSINFTVAGRDDDIVKTEISFDNGLTRTVVLPDADGDFVANGSALTPGTKVATVYVTDEAGNVASKTMTFVVGAGATGGPITIQAEDATKVTVQDTGVSTSADFTRVVNAANPDATGNFRAGAVDGAYMDFGANAGDAITISVNAATAGAYQVTFRYANGGAANRPLELSLNGASATAVDFVPGPVIGTGTTASGWESWVEKTVTLNLTAGANTIKLAIPSGATAGPNIDQIVFTPPGGSGPVEPVPFLLTLQAEAFTPIDTTGTGNQITQARTLTNPEPTLPLLRDVNSDGLWDGFTGTGYLDMGAQIGDAASFKVTAPTAGTYTFTFRFSNGGGAPNGDRPMTLVVSGGETKTVSFPGTGVNGWDAWTTTTVEVVLAAGENTLTIANTVANGPNLDSVTVSKDDVGTGGPIDPRAQQTFVEVVKVNFEPAPGQTTQGLPAGYQTPTGYLSDVGAAYGARGNGFSYGWVSETSVADGTANGTTPLAQPANAHWYKNTVTGASNLQKTYAHFEYPGASGDNARAWEIGLENGTYQVRISVGDTAGAFDSSYAINVEGQRFGSTFVPANPGGNGNLNGGGFRSTLVTGIVQVQDGKLTVDSIGGVNTEMQYVEIERVPDVTPTDNRAADLDYSFFVAPRAAYLNDQVSLEIGDDGSLPVGINPLASLVVGVNVQAPGYRGPNIAHVDGIKLVETLTGVEVAINVQISGGADSLTIRPLAQLKENTSYTLLVEDVLDLGSITDGTAPLRQMQDLTTTFVTGVAPVEVAREVAFTTQTLLNGFADEAGGFTSIEFGPDGKLYVATIMGEIYRWTVNSDGTINKASKESLILDYLAQDGDRRGIIGFVFDPADPNTIWISDNYPIPRENKAFNTPEFSGQISKITLGAGGSFTGATAETYITGLPRSGGDHVTNSLEFRANPNAGQPGEPAYLLYLSQGSNSAAGAPDGAWGNRPERLLNAAILEIDPTRDAPNGGFNVRTEPVTAPTTQNTGFNADGTYPGFYNPYAADAVLKIYATGVRNAYDLVWHSNGQLYVAANGTASGGKTFDDPTQAGSQVITNSPTQDDYFFTIKEGMYYGHTNILRGEYILNGGNPTAGVDKNEVTDRKDGNPNTDGYDAGVAYDPNYDIAGAYSLGRNQSPNGSIEYKGSAFGSNLKGALLIAQFSTGDNVRSILVDQDGKIIGDDVLRRPDGSIINNYIDPLDIIENPLTGQLYLMTLNRGTGASQLVLLTPAPGGVTQDISADENGDLALVVVNASNPDAVVFQVNGLDSDITAIRVNFNNGLQQTVTLNAQKQFTIDPNIDTGPITARVEVTDDALNRASVSTTFTPGSTNPNPGSLVPLLTIQAEDNTPADGTSVVAATGGTSQIQIRTTTNPEPSTTTGLVGGLRPGAFGLDGNTVNTDGVAGGYADFGASNADFVTFTFSVPADQAGSGMIKVRFANGGTADRPLGLVVNGAAAGTVSFLPPVGVTGDAAWTTWQVVDVPVSLVAGLNTVTFQATAGTGPNIDQIEVLAPEPTTQNVPYAYYEAENAQLVGATVVTENRNQEGAGFVDFVGTGNQSITWTVNSANAGSFEIAFRYALADSKADRPLSLTVNGVSLGQVNFEGFGPDAENTWQFQTALVNLVQGANTITVTAPNAVGPNIDQLRVATGAAAPPFEPDYVSITTGSRIELEQTADNSTRVLNNQAVEFFFEVAQDGLYALDLAANAGAPNGQGLRLFLNGVAVETLAFPGVGTAGEKTAYLQLDAGTQYQLRVLSNAPGASAIDYLDVRLAPGNANADIAVQSLDPAYLDNRLHFSFLEDPDAVEPDSADRDFKDSGTVRITNTGTEALTFTSHELTGPFVLANPTQLDGLSIAAGQSVDVTVLFNRAAYTPPTTNVDATSTVFTGALKLITNDADTPFTTIDLAGFWQARDEGGQEPNVNEIWKIFGFGNVIENLTLRGGGENSSLSTDDVFAKTDETEVLSPYWRIADGFTQAKVTQIAAFHGTGGATFHIHNPNNKGANVQFWNHEGTDNQRLLPNAGNDTSFATRTFTRADIPDGWVGNDIFGISVAGLSSDPRLNPRGNVEVVGAQQGHTVKIFQALDANGAVIPNVYLGIMDYTGINYDYNDNLFVIEGVTPVGFGQSMTVAGLDSAAADERLVFTNIDTPANAQQAFRNEAVITITNDGAAALTIESIEIGNPAFQIVGATPTSVAAGASATVTVRFVGTHSGTTAGAELYETTLTIVSNDFTQGQKVITLAGLAQEFSENNSEPTVAQIVEAFGYGTDVAQGELAGGGVVEVIGDEVLMPYLERLDATKSIEVIQIAAFLNQGNVARLGFHGLGSSQVTNLFANDDQQGQTVLPDQLVTGAGAGASAARGTITQAGPFGLYISVDGRPTYSSWTDPKANDIDPNFGNLVDTGEGHLIRFFQALDQAGNVIVGTYIAIQDYPGAGNYDYNDHMFVIKNVKPHELTAANDANNNDVNDALETDTDADGTVNFFDTTTTPPTGPQAPFGGTAPAFANGLLTLDASNYDTGGQGVAYSDNSGRDGGSTTFRTGDAVEFVGTENDVGYVRPGEWLEYTVNVPTAGVYDMSFLAKTPLANATVAISIAGGATLATATLQDGGASFSAAPFQASAPVGVSLGAGVQTIRLTFNGTPEAGSLYLMDLRSVSFDYREPPAPVTQTPLGGSPATFVNGALTVDASNYDNGGQGVAYNDAVGLQGGSNGGRTGSAVEQTGTGDIGWIEAGEWLEYTIDVPTAGAYRLTFNTATPDPGRSLTATFEQSGSVYRTVAGVAAPDTNSYTAFANSAPTTVDLAAGVQVVRVAFSGGAMDFRSFGLQAVTAPLPTVSISAATPTVTEGTATTASFTIQLSAAQSSAVTVEYSTVAGTATAGSDFTAVTTATATIAAGQTSVTVTVPILNDTAVEPNETLSVAIANARLGTQALAITAANAGVTIVSEDVAPTPSQTPFGGTASAFVNGLLTVDASNYDNGGQGVAYNDAVGLQGGSNGGRTGSAVEQTGTGDIGWIEAGEWLEYTIDVPTAGAYRLTFNTATPDPGRSLTATFEQSGSVYRTVAGVAAPDTNSYTTFANGAPTTVDLAAGVQVVRVAFAGGAMDFRSFGLQAVTAPLPTVSISAVAPTVTEGAATTASFTIQLSAAQSSAVTVEYSTVAGTATAGSDFTAVTTATATIAAGQTSVTVTVPILNDTAVEPNETLSVAIANARLGTQALAITAANAGVTIVSEDVAPTPSQTPFNATQTPWLVDGDGITISAANYDNGGQGVAFNDTNTAQLGNTTYRPGTAVDIVGAGTAVGWVESGEWLEYTINVQQAGTYNLSFLTAAVTSGRSITATFEKNGVVYETAAPAPVANTGQWSTYAGTQAVQVELEAGVQTVRMSLAGGSMDIRSLSITPLAVSPADLDGDGVLNLADPFFADATNGAFGVGAGEKFVFTFDGTAPGGAPLGFGSGLTGLRINGSSTPQQLGIDDAGFTVADGQVRIASVPAGDSYYEANDLKYGAQLGVTPEAKYILVSTTFDNPFDGRTPDSYQNMGLSIGTGDQSDYLKLVLEGGSDGNPYMRVEMEVNDVRTVSQNYTSQAAALRNVDANDTVTVSLIVDAETGIAVPRWAFTSNVGTGSFTGTGAQVQLTGEVLAALQGNHTLAKAAGGTLASGLAVGLHATSFDSQPFEARFLEVTVAGADTMNELLQIA
ncbi:carbohydrate-binding protein [Bosea sp. PAMC 26642]|uniref:carbohydrate-binding protein n=1 Tax=Bosea sp. (strain PAMC 26642) TaxID=1792307 RepID=UPI0007706999|nr:carbohydrate-binding protein [Bosea sp. PAMC 26642]AMJ62924.1 hypothetical protein AXW83_23815 [Bosea sp. PAMC 26642]